MIKISLPRRLAGDEYTVHRMLISCVDLAAGYIVTCAASSAQAAEQTRQSISECISLDLFRGCDCRADVIDVPSGIHCTKLREVLEEIAADVSAAHLAHA